MKGFSGSLGWHFQEIRDSKDEKALGTHPGEREFLFLVEGACRFHQTGLDLELPSPALILLPPGERGHLQPGRDLRLWWCWVSPEWMETCRELLPGHSLWQDWELQSDTGAPTRRDRSRALILEMPPGLALEADHRFGLWAGSPAPGPEKLLEWCALLLRLHGTDSATSDTTTGALKDPGALLSGVPLSGTGEALAPALKTILEQLHRNYHQDWDLDSLSRLVGWNPDYLSRNFSKTLGHPVIEHLNRVRIQEACHLLRTTDQPILDIALAVGYNNISFFNRTFRRLRTCSPREYRQGQINQ